MRKCRDELDAALGIAPSDPDNLFEENRFPSAGAQNRGRRQEEAVDLAERLLKIDPARGNLAFAHIAVKQREFGQTGELVPKGCRSEDTSARRVWPAC